MRRDFDRSFPLASSLAIFLGLLNSAHAGTETLEKRASSALHVEEAWTLPLLEISGLSLHEKSLYLASDKSRNFLRVPLKTVASRDLDLAKSDEVTIAADIETAELASEDGKADTEKEEKKKKKKGKKKKNKNKKSQWEALAIDKAGTFFAVKESHDQIFVYGADGQFKRNYQLTSFERRAHKSKGYEGILLLKKSHVLIALSNAPILVEFGPKGDTPLGVSAESILPKDQTFSESADKDLYPLASWELDSPGSCELSDLTVDAQGQAFALLKTCAKIIPIPSLDPRNKSFEAVQSWSFPMELEHAEGLLSASPGGFLIAVDFKSEKKNLFWLTAKDEKAKP